MAPVTASTRADENLGATDGDENTDTRLDLGVSSEPSAEADSTPQRFVATDPPAADAEGAVEPAEEEPTTEEPVEDEPTAVAPAPAPEETEDEPTGTVYYKNCDAVRAAGAAPIRVGDPGYAKHLDRDGDGQGCGSD